MKTTSHGRQLQNIKSGISQQSLLGSYSYFKLKLRLPKIKLSSASQYAGHYAGQYVGQYAIHYAVYHGSNYSGHYAL
jgi:hypothetical protein